MTPSEIHTATYLHTPAALLTDPVKTLTFDNGTSTMLTVEERLDHLNRLTSITSNPAVGSATSYTYTYNDANQRQIAELENGEYWAYNYDPLGQVTSGKKHDKIGATPDPQTDPVILGHDYGYTFDDIGNRTQTSTNGRNAAYTPNLLNQYTQREVPGYLNIVGQAGTDPGLTITANATAVARTDDYFHAEVPVDNSAGPVWEEITVTGLIPGAGEGGSDAVAEETGYKFLEKDPVAPVYDEDGNLSSDGRWSYTWNAENRLIEMTPLPAAVSAGAPNIRLQFTYDNLGRRIKKSVSVWSGNAYIWVQDTIFLYDGWNSIYERIVKASFGLVEERKYVWGLDKSDIYQGAGGIGALLFIDRSNVEESINETWYVGYDGNGNVAILYDAATGITTAEYEYGSFGEPIRMTGPAANINPFRFSTKYTDSESGLVYFGFRFYDNAVGRWLSRDPIEERGGLNLYGYVDNNPLNFFDFLGLSSNCLSTIECEALKADIDRRERGLANEVVRVGQKAGVLPENYTAKDLVSDLDKALTYPGAANTLFNIVGGDSNLGTKITGTTLATVSVGVNLGVYGAALATGDYDTALDRSVNLTIDGTALIVTTYGAEKAKQAATSVAARSLTSTIIGQIASKSNIVLGIGSLGSLGFEKAGKAYVNRLDSLFEKLAKQTRVNNFTDAQTTISRLNNSYRENCLN